MNETLSSRTLLLRNIRGNWSARFLHEYHFRHKEDGEFLFVNLTNLEVFPPHKPAPLFIGAKQRERLNSRFLFRNPLPELLEQSMKSAGVEIVQTRFVHSLLAVMMVAKVWNVKTSQELDEFKVSGIPYGKFIHTTLIAKYGIKHFKMGIIERSSNLLIYYRFFIAYFYLLKLTKRTNVTRIVMINGRDIVGVAAQLCAFVNRMSVITLEAGFGLSPVPLYGEWQGNMHHWRVRQLELLKVAKRNPTFVKADEFMEFAYGKNSRWWKRSEESLKLVELPEERFICFFTTSERESTCCPTGIPKSNSFDEYDQLSQIRLVYRAAKNLNCKMVLRVHPNFSKSQSAIRESAFFEDLANELTDIVVIPNFSSMDSYEIARKAWLVFTFRSSLSAEFARMGIRCVQTAPTAWTPFTRGQPLTTLVDLQKAIDSPNDNVFVDKSAYKPFAAYYALHGTSFESIQLSFSNDSHKDGSIVLVQKLNDVILDVPKYRFKVKRN